MSKQFNIWAAGDSHVGTDIKRGRRSLEDALVQSESDDLGFDWDIMLDVGDLSGSQHTPDDEEGRLVQSQYASLKKHRREQIYNILGNHDASGPDEPTQWWFKKFVDPMGDSPQTSGIENARRPYAVDGTWERYKFQAGNVLFLMMGDRNDGGPPVGRGKYGGYPSGAVTGETFDWWVDQVESNQDKIIISAHHLMLKNTTIGSGEWDGYFTDPKTGQPIRDKYGKPTAEFHGYFSDGGPMGAGYLYWVDGHPDAQAFERYLEAHPGAIDLWLGGHTHSRPDRTKAGRSHCEKKWGVTFLNCAAMTKYHHCQGNLDSTPMSRMITLTPGSNEGLIRCRLHTDDLAPRGWYKPAERTLTLRHAFEMKG